MTSKQIIEILRRRMVAEQRSVYRIGRDTGIAYSVLWRLSARARDGLHLTTVVKLAHAVGYEVVVRRKRKG